jgi:hypothetical protein
MKALLLHMIIILLFMPQVFGQHKQTIMINDFENKPSTTLWWRDNGNVHFTYDDNTQQVNKHSKTCLYVRWDSTTGHPPHTWFTDLKADTFAVEGMEASWAAFRQNTWLSFWCKGGQGDSLLLHYLVLSKGHSSKWGATTMVPVVANKWTFYKVRFADLTYENWGKITADFDLNTTTGRCFEVGLRSGASSPKGYIEAWFDNIQLTNFEPFK